MALQAQIQTSSAFITKLPNLLGDKTRLQQVLINLIRNALKFTPFEGQIDIKVEYNATEQSLCVDVQDSGLGIAQEDLGKLFNQFGKLQRSATMNSDGIGLGLRICKELVEQNGGTICVKSEGIGRGSCFSFTMKMDEVDQVSLDTQAQLLLIPERPNGGYRRSN